MRWTIEGADEKTGAEQTVSVTAITATEAEKIARRRGILIASVQPDEEPTYADRLATMVNPEDAKPEQPGFLSRLVKPSPPYTGLQLGASILMGMALLVYLFAGGALIASFVAACERPESFAPFNAVTLLLLGIASGMFGGLLHTISASCFALSDLARNSFQMMSTIGAVDGPSGMSRANRVVSRF